MIFNFKRPTLIVGLFFSLMFLSGCATYQNKVQEARDALQRRDYETSLKGFEPLANKEDGDQLVYLLDYGTALQVSGNIKDSNKIFLKADRLSEQVDYQSVSRIAGSLALNEEMVQYKGDTFEKIFINAYLAMNFLQENRLDDALVEARRINEKYLKFRADEKKAFELNSFSKYLSGMIWEASRNYDDAYIAYEEAYKIDPTISTIGEDLVRASKLARREDSNKKWKKQFPQVKERSEWSDRSMGELVVIYQQGWGPRKAPTPGSAAMPTLLPVYSRTQYVQLSVDGGSTVTSQPIYDVQSAAIKTLVDDQGLLLAKRMAALAAKEVLASQVRQKNELLGAVAWIAMHASERADLRQWSLLPQTIQTARIYLKPGKYKFSLQGLDAGKTATGESLMDQEVEIKAGQKKFIVWRSLK